MIRMPRGLDQPSDVPPPPRENTSDAPAPITDAQMVETGSELIGISDLANPKKWEGLSEAQREAAIRDCAGRLGDAYGVRLGGVLFYNGAERSYGRYNPYVKSIELNRNFVADGRNREQAMETLAHEMRHAVQDAACAQPDKFGIPRETVDLWRDNFQHYVRPEMDFMAYYNQPVERDAREFADAVIKGVQTC